MGTKRERLDASFASMTTTIVALACALSCGAEDGEDGSSGSVGDIDGEAAVICEDGTSSIIGTSDEGDEEQEVEIQQGLGGQAELQEQLDETDEGAEKATPDEVCEIREEENGDRTIACPDGTELSVGQGSEGLPLIEAEWENPGKNCSAGGQLIRVGNDRNADGRLDDAEVTDSQFACEQHVVIGDVNLYTQAELDAYIDVSVVTGALIIEGVDIVDLSPLAALKSVGGDLLIRGCESLADLTGLEALGTVRGDLYVEYNPRLAELVGLTGLRTVVGSLYVRNNTLLPSLRGLEALSGVGSAIHVWNNDRLEALHGLEQLKSIGGALNIQSNRALVTVEGLDLLETVGAGVDFFDNASLISLEGLEALESVTGSFYLGSNHSLEELSALSHLQEVGGDLIVENHDVLPTCEAEWLRNNLLDLGGSTTIVSNNDTGVCAVDEDETGGAD